MQPIYKGREHLKSSKRDRKKLLKCYEKGQVERRRHEEHKETTYKQPQLSNPHTIFKCKFNVILHVVPIFRASLPKSYKHFSSHVRYMPRPSHHVSMQNATYGFLRYKPSCNNVLPPPPLSSKYFSQYPVLRLVFVWVHLASDIRFHILKKTTENIPNMKVSNGSTKSWG